MLPSGLTRKETRIFLYKRQLASRKFGMTQILSYYIINDDKYFSLLGKFMWKTYDQIKCARKEKKDKAQFL